MIKIDLCCVYKLVFMIRVSASLFVWQVVYSGIKTRPETECTCTRAHHSTYVCARLTGEMMSSRMEAVLLIFNNSIPPLTVYICLCEPAMKYITTTTTTLNIRHYCSCTVSCLKLNQNKLTACLFGRLKTTVYHCLMIRFALDMWIISFKNLVNYLCSCAHAFTCVYAPKNSLALVQLNVVLPWFCGFLETDLVT